jgi:hypothetical protein
LASLGKPGAKTGFFAEKTAVKSASMLNSAQDSKSPGEIRAGSIPAPGTNDSLLSF